MERIARVWFGRTQAARVDEYVEYMKKTGVDALAKTPGNLGVLMFKRIDGKEAEVGVISFWDSRESIQAFAGKDINKAVYYPEDRNFLVELTPELVHYEIPVAEKITFDSSR